MTLPVVAVDGRVVFVEDGAAAPVGGGIAADGFSVVHLFRRGWLWFGYLRDSQGVWWFDGKRRGATLVTADADGFRVVDDDYGLDSEHVYLEARPIPGADPASFEMLADTPYFARDRARLYVKGGQHFFWFDEVDAASLIANGQYVTDRDHLFHHSAGLTYANQDKETATVTHRSDNEHDMLLVDWLRKHHSGTAGWWHADYDRAPTGARPLAHDWHRTADAVFFAERTGFGGEARLTWNLVRGADPATFTVLDEVHGRDASGVFCRWRRVRAAEPESFRVLGGRFGVDADRVYFNGYAVAGADPGTFTAIPAVVEFGKDRKRLFRRDFTRTTQPFGPPDEVLVAVGGADPDTFQVFGDRGVWAADATTVYLRGAPKRKLDAASFRFLGETPTNCWACDRNGLYRSNGSLVVAGVEGASFVKLDDHWGTDGAVVFSFVTGAVQKAADAATFRVVDPDGGAEDRDACYRIENGSVRKRKRTN
ncbi:hypothetical protein MMAG44476_24079 [Mycolicibacterium mageritense DSM 44476 = CIP 104973]|uniref:DKNYY family protein n=1 Tax=Mycolicibacterium mageritense TaxID=53462 RepID=A0ABN5YFD4_MYCME|nr:DKNYY domain-containing protein [Mycolicibacterium mageritense]MCC9185817.1 DKNYY domain-containing protein [Mycolicibacterium mageritense]BBX36813.1 hypothetical protein MMAGJ_60950 [Mycolicibacterium mageritense]CDO26444.1 hypothetical protein BN978_06999 [Mycolicibacterium mageritense DSM 44476 = CIP 104973]